MKNYAVPKPPRLFKALDIFCILAVLLVSALLFFAARSCFFDPAQDTHLSINADGRTYTLPLDTDRTETVCSGGITLTVCISDGAAWVEASTCPDHVCSSMGKISRAGQTVVCVPAGFSMTVVTRGSSGEVTPDAIVG